MGQALYFICIITLWQAPVVIQKTEVRAAKLPKGPEPVTGRARLKPVPESAGSEKDIRLPHGTQAQRPEPPASSCRTEQAAGPRRPAGSKEKPFQGPWVQAPVQLGY